RGSLPTAPAAPAAAPAPPPPPPPPDPQAEAERALLGTLRARRVELDRRAEELNQRELLIQASEQRVTARLEEMRALQTRLEGELRARDEREEAGIRQLVRVYESMRPRDAATILDDLEMPVLLQVIDRMREAKAAPVLAAMRPDRARAVTTELSRLRSRSPD
ncbi:MotE family protein, partial [Rhodovarius crocodyli]|uniref:MotE family protein n=1 Tax=Rhodovarius crocodyli TaxID=1979269 RepID=UPI0038D14701